MKNTKEINNQNNSSQSNFLKGFKNIVNFTNVLALIGALSWIPFLFEKCQSAEVKGKIISFYGNSGKFRGIENSSLILFRISLYSENKSFAFSSLELFIRFNKTGWKKATLNTPRKQVWTFDDGHYNMLGKNLNYINLDVQLPKEQSINGYLSCFIPNEIIDEKVEEIELVFIDFDGKVKKVRLKGIADEQKYFDDSIFEKLTTPQFDTLRSKF